MPQYSSSTLLTSIVAAACSAAFVYTKLQKKKSSFFPSSSSVIASRTYIFVGDIGGTNTRLAIYSTSSASSLPIYQKEYSNEKYITDPSKSFEHDIFLPFLSECDIEWDHNTAVIACFAVAGPVRNNKVTMTNLGGQSFVSAKDVDSSRLEIVLDGNKVESNSHGLLRFISRCKIVNDFVGQGYGLLDLDLDKEVVELTPGSRKMMDPLGPKACVGAGTGLGECFLTTSSLHPEEGYECYPSEGGHVDFAPRDALQMKLLEYLKDKFDQPHRVSVERVVSGKGLANVYEFLAKQFPDKVNGDLHKEFESAGALQGRVVGVNANNNACPLCVQAMEIMMSAYGAEVGNCGVKFIPTGGLYVSGGLTPKNIKFIQGKDSPFMKAYGDKGRMSKLLENVPLVGVLVEDLGLRGARVCAMRVSFYVWIALLSDNYL